jgi:Putative Flp pilus-assembly TadE/G-like
VVALMLVVLLGFAALVIDVGLNWAARTQAQAAAIRGPAVSGPAPCAICLLDRHAAQALSVTGNGDVTVADAGVMVNSDDPQAAVLTSSGDLTAVSIGVVGGWAATSSGGFTPTPDTRVGPLPDPLADLPTPDQLVSLVGRGSVTVDSADQSIGPGVYETIAVTGGGDLTLDPGIYVVTGGLTLSAGAVLGDGVTIYLACDGYPTPCSGAGATFSQTGSGQYLATPTITGPYQGLALFADRANTAPLSFTGSATSTFTGTIYARQGAMSLTSGGVALALDSLIVVRTLEVSSSAEVLLSFIPANNAVTSSWGAILTK